MYCQNVDRVVKGTVFDGVDPTAHVNKMYLFPVGAVNTDNRRLDIFHRQTILIEPLESVRCHFHGEINAKFNLPSNFV